MSGEDAIDVNLFKLIRQVLQWFTLLSKFFDVIRSGKSKKTEKTDSTTTKIDKDADVYNMNHYKRGSAIIFNHYQFDNKMLESREGTDKDVTALEETLRLLQFDVVVCNDYTYSQIYDKLQEGMLIDYYQQNRTIMAFTCSV